MKQQEQTFIYPEQQMRMKALEMAVKEFEKRNVVGMDDFNIKDAAEKYYQFIKNGI